MQVIPVPFSELVVSGVS